MKRLIKIAAGIIILMFIFSACNRYVVCPAYADKNIKTEQKKDNS
jgi:hypothetical protein